MAWLHAIAAKDEHALQAGGCRPPIATTFYTTGLQAQRQRQRRRRRARQSCSKGSVHHALAAVLEQYHACT
eukprot:1144903-Pyramimonas_sp.AAC.1